MAQSSSVVRIGAPAREASVSAQEVCLFLHSVSNIAYGPVATGGACPSVVRGQQAKLRLVAMSVRLSASRLRFSASSLWSRRPCSLGSHLSLQLAPWSLRLGGSNLQPCGFFFFRSASWADDRMEGAGKAGGGGGGRRGGRTATCVRTHSPAESFLSGAFVVDVALGGFPLALTSCVSVGAGGVRIDRSPSRRQSLSGLRRPRSLTNKQLSLRTEHLVWSVLQGES